MIALECAVFWSLNTAEESATNMRPAEKREHFHSKVGGARPDEVDSSLNCPRRALAGVVWSVKVPVVLVMPASFRRRLARSRAGSSPLRLPDGMRNNEKVEQRISPVVRAHPVPASPRSQEA